MKNTDSVELHTYLVRTLADEILRARCGSEDENIALLQLCDALKVKISDDLILSAKAAADEDKSFLQSNLQEISRKHMFLIRTLADEILRARSACQEEGLALQQLSDNLQIEFSNEQYLAAQAMANRDWVEKQFDLQVS